LRGLRRDGLLRELRLGPLAPAEIEALLRARMAGADAERLARECGGNPLLALELARAEIEGGEGGGSLDELVRERLARFDAEGGEVLRWAAVLGPPIHLPALLELTGVDGAVVGRALEEAERQAVLVSSGEGLRFAHNLIARAIYTGISSVRRQLMHRKVATWLEQDPGYELARAAALAHHAGLSGDAGLAARAMVSAGKLCLRFFANEDARALAQKGLQLAAQLPAAEEVRLAIELHGVLLAAAPLEDWEGAAGQFTALAERALDHGAPAHARQAYQMAALVRWQHGQWAGAHEQSLQSERVARSGGECEHIVGLAEHAKCLVLLERDLAQADAMLMEAQALAQRAHLAHRAIPAALGMLRFYENRMGEAAELLEQARTLCKWAGDRLNEYLAE
jgi:predicted ATPase